MSKLVALPLAVALVALTAASAPGAPAQPLPGLTPSVDRGFHMEPRPAIDDVFGDSAEYKKTVERFLELADSMERMREHFARAVQSVLIEINAGPGKPKPKKCPDAAVALPYARALDLGQAYLKAGRELARRHDQIREFDRLGESAGLTPDLRARVKQVFAQYQALLVDYREMKAAFHDQLADELRFAGCDLDRLLARAGATAHDDAWPSGGPLGDDAAAVPVRADADAPVPAAGSSAAAPARAGSEPLPAGARVPPDRSGILFYVDNTRCPGAARVTLDGRPLGEVPPATRAAFQTTPGPHDLCLLPETPNSNSPPRRCGEPGTIRRSYLSEGWTIALRCE